MSKKQHVKAAPVMATKTAISQPERWYQTKNLVPLAVCVAYLGVHYVPDFNAYDAMGPQWLYILLVDFVVTIYILSARQQYEQALAILAKNVFSRLYFCFFLLAGISIITAINPTEGWVCYVRLIATFIAFINLGVILYGRTDIFKWLAQIVGIVLLTDAVHTLTLLATSTGEMSMSQLITSLKAKTGNKNIFAAGLIVKIPFVVYCIHTGNNLKKAVNILILFWGCFAIYLANARAAYLSLILISIFYITFCIIENRKQKNVEQLLYVVGRFLIPLIAALFVSQAVLTNLVQLEDNKNQGFGSVAARLGSISAADQSSQIRLQLWQHAVNYTAKHPIIGCGYGNWKIASIPYIRTVTDDLYVPVHAHNDFVETFAELGIPGGLLYLSLFICILVFTFKTYRSPRSEESKLISVFTFLAFIGYSVDAFFNFPMERPISQVFFVFITALNIVAYLEAAPAGDMGNARSRLLKPIVGLVSLLLMLPSAYIMFRTHQSLIIQRQLIPDLEHEPLQMKWQELFPKIPSIPNLTASAMPLDGIKGRYLSEAGKYDEALVHLNRAIAANPTIAYSDFLKAGLFYKIEKWDSAVANGLRAFKTRPRAKTYYQTLMAILSKTKDTVRIKQTFEEYNRYRPGVFAWNLYLIAMLNSVGKGTPALLALADSAHRMHAKEPDDSMLLQRKAEIIRFMGGGATTASSNDDAQKQLARAQGYYTAGVEAFARAQAIPAPKNKPAYLESARNFIRAGEIITNNYVIYENAGISYFNMGEFAKAIPFFDKVTAMQTSQDGKSEYFKGVAYYNLGNKAEGCKWIGIADKKGYKEAGMILQNNCK